MRSNTVMFQSAARILGFPKRWLAEQDEQLTMFHSAARILGFPKDDRQRRQEQGQRRFNPPRGFLASQSLHAYRSPCRYKRWFQSAARILGFPKHLSTRRA